MHFSQCSSLKGCINKNILSNVTNHILYEHSLLTSGKILALYSGYLSTPFVGPFVTFYYTMDFSLYIIDRKKSIQDCSHINLIKDCLSYYHSSSTEYKN